MEFHKRRHMGKSAVLAVICCLATCQATLAGSPAEGVLAGDHQLRKLGRVSTNAVSVCDGYAWMEPRSDGSQHFLFCWKASDGNWQVSEIPLGKLRIKAEDVEVPFIKFRWSSSRSAIPEEIMRDNVIYVLLVCKKEWLFNDPPVQLEVNKE